MAVDREKILVLAALALSAWAAQVLWVFGGSEDRARADREAPRPAEQEILYTFDIFDKRQLVGYSDNVFVGRVLKKVGDEPLKTTIPGAKPPQTQYSVAVLETIKSGGPDPLAAGDEAIVNQSGGVDPETGRQLVVIGASATDGHAADSPLRPGEEYLFATRYDPTEHWHAISAQPTGDVPLSGATERAEVVAAFTEAAAQQVDPLAGGRVGA
ncbi:MAG TPA: hypothetical protein VKA51_02645 [Rubrobacteraceae bacterium]|nr:hypothetical protein [Rubrobacteraceae bacterium]